MKHAALSPVPRGKTGMAMFGIVMVLATLSVIATTVYTVVSTNVSISGHHKRQQQSFFQADAGIHYAQAMITEGLQNRTINIDANHVALNIPPPAGFTFDPITQLTRLADTNLWVMRVTGRTLGAATTIEAILGRRNALSNIGVFGDRELRMQPGFEVYSYDSDQVVNPTPSDSTGVAGVGSNYLVVFSPGSGVDGTIFLGADAADNVAALQGDPGVVPIETIPRVPPDPLGAIGGPLADSFLYYSNPANNDNDAAGLTDGILKLKTKESFTLTNGVYYLSEISLATQSTLEIISTPENPVVIFLTGSLVTQPSTVVASSCQTAKGLYILSNNTEGINIRPNSEFRAFVYSPYAALKVLPNDDVYGVFWGNTIDLQPNGDVFIDSSLLDDLLSGYLEVVQWREIR